MKTKTRSRLKPDIRTTMGHRQPWRTAAGLMMTLACFTLLAGYAGAGETLSTNAQNVTVDKSATMSPTVKENLCGGCYDDEGLNSECRVSGDVCLEKKEVQLYLNSKLYQDLKQAIPHASKSDFVLLVYMVDYLFHDGAHLSGENLAALADQDICPEINIECLSQTVNRVLTIDVSTVKSSTQ